MNTWLGASSHHPRLDGANRFFDAQPAQVGAPRHRHRPSGRPNTTRARHRCWRRKRQYRPERHAQSTEPARLPRPTPDQVATSFPPVKGARHPRCEQTLVGPVRRWPGRRGLISHFISRSSDLQRRNLSHVMSSGFGLKPVSFFPYDGICVRPGASRIAMAGQRTARRYSGRTAPHTTTRSSGTRLGWRRRTRPTI